MKKTIAAACLAATVATVACTHAMAKTDDASPLAVLRQEAVRKAAEAPAAEATQTTTKRTHAHLKRTHRLTRHAKAHETRKTKLASLETSSVAPAQAADEAATESKGKALSSAPGARGGLKDLIAKHAAANGVPYALADAVVRIESRYNPGATNGGAVGLMQIKPQTARGLGYAGGASGLKNPETNLTYGMKYLAQAYRMSGGSTCATVMRYQSGHYAKHANAANRAYCGKAQAIMASN